GKAQKFCVIGINKMFVKRYRLGLKHIFIVFLCLFISIVSFPGLYSFIVHNLHSPLFSESKFSLRNYRSEKNFSDALWVMFPIGTERTYIESILVKRQGLLPGFSNGERGHYFITYSYPRSGIPPFSPFFWDDPGLRQAQFEYDETNRVVAIKSHI